MHRYVIVDTFWHQSAQCICDTSVSTETNVGKVKNRYTSDGIQRRSYMIWSRWHDKCGIRYISICIIMINTWHFLPLPYIDIFDEACTLSHVTSPLTIEILTRFGNWSSVTRTLPSAKNLVQWRICTVWIDFKNTKNQDNKENTPTHLCSVRMLFVLMRSGTNYCYFRNIGTRLPYGNPFNNLNVW